VEFSIRNILLKPNFYCDTYGIGTITWSTLTAFIMECFQNGILNMERTGGLDSEFGNSCTCSEMLHQLARGEGFWQDCRNRCPQDERAVQLKTDGVRPHSLMISQWKIRDLNILITCRKNLSLSRGGFALQIKGPQHDEAWLIFMDMVNNQIPTFENKAEALHYFPMFRTWFGLVGPVQASME